MATASVAGQPVPVAALLLPLVTPAFKRDTLLSCKLVFAPKRLMLACMPTMVALAGILKLNPVAVSADELVLLAKDTVALLLSLSRMLPGVVHPVPAPVPGALFKLVVDTGQVELTLNEPLPPVQIDAFTVVGPAVPELNVMITSSVEGVQAPLEMVHRKVYEVPTVPVKVEVALETEFNVPPVPLMMLQAPVPTEGALAERVAVVVPQITWSAPALDVVGAVLVVMAPDTVLVTVQPFELVTTT